MNRIWLVDHPGSGAPDHKVLAAMAAACQKGIDGDFGPALGRGCSFAFGDTKDMAPGDRILGLFADMDQPNALGYHLPEQIEDPTIANPLIGKVAPMLDAQDGAALSQTIDHELKEALEDLYCNVIVTCADGRLAADECADAVEADGGYAIDGFPLSNFVLPGWYTGKGKFDFLGKLSRPMSVTPGGYCQFYDASKGWQMVTAEGAPPRAYRRLPGRCARRKPRQRPSWWQRLVGWL